MKTLSFCFVVGFFLLPAHADFHPLEFSDFQKEWSGEIPFPPEKLKASLLALDRGSSIHAAILPHGRSLQRSTTDFELPRTVMAWRNSKSSSPYFLFLGYAARNERLEVISWNWRTRQFDFGLVTDYAAGKKPRYDPVKASACIACHQSRVPIFSEAPWSESTFLPTLKSRIEREAKDPFARSWLRTRRRQVLSSPDVDLAVLEAASLAQTQKFCQSACGGDLECRRQVLATALFETLREGSAYAEFDAYSLARRVSAMRAHWPKDDFTFAAAEIPDRELGSDGARISVVEDPLRIRRKSATLQPESAADYYFLRRYRYCWNFTASQKKKLERLGKNRIRRAIDTEETHQLVKEWLPSEDRVIDALERASQAPSPIQGETQIPWQSPDAPPRLVRDPGRPRQPTETLFLQYCSSCHGGDARAQPPGLPLADLNALRSYVGTAERTVRELIDPNQPLMPPLGAPQPSREEMEQMRSYLQ